ncbi:MAG: glycosyl transferase family 1 [Crocinitomicaceae bacterium]|nr:glycosyl transferase family 1 [Crocinitomicaceae bacterium]|tara:strand:- start:17778 stop:19034 length:1257 start_codon:yes stop_codon:yes gene_type:complete
MKVLIVTYYWPPSGGGGVQRWLKFATYLDKLGCACAIYTPSNPDVPIIDSSLLDDVPTNIEVLTNPISEPSRILRKITWQYGSNRIGASSGGGKNSLFSRLSLWVRGNLFIPDARVGWVKPSVKFLKGWLVKNKVDAIITTGPPHSMHLIGLGLKKDNPQLQWIADFRDPWSDMDYLDEFNMGPRARAKMEDLESEVSRTADRLIVTSRGARDKLVNSQKAICIFIPNGWDALDFPKSLPKENDNTVTRIGHFGALHGSRNAPGLWKAVSDLKAKGQDVELVFAGHVCSDIKRDLKKFGLIKATEFLGSLAHRKAIEEMLKCDVLLLIHNDTNSATKSTPGKLFEYLATSKPIISICKSHGDLASLLNNWGLPHARHNDVERCKEILQNFQAQTPVDPAPFTRMKLTEKLLEVIKSTQ